MTPHNKKKAIFLFSSPQAIVNDRNPWCSILKTLHGSGVLKLVVIDELHLYLQFGVSLRSEFKHLTTKLLDHIFPVSNKKKHPALLVMTATISASWLLLFKKMTKLTFLPCDILWASANEMSRRDVKMAFFVGDSILKAMRGSLINFLKSSTTKTAILYCETPKSAMSLKISIDELMDVESIDGDCIVIHGQLESYTKFYQAKLFTGAHDDGVLKPRVLIATSGCANAGIDSPHVHWVLRQDMPPSVLDLFQEMGRAGRRTIKTFGDDHYIVIFSLSSFAYLIRRAHNQVDDIIKPFVTSKKEKTQMSMDALMEVLKVLVLDFGCKHRQIECLLGRPSAMETVELSLGPCRLACPTCQSRSVYEHVFTPICRLGIQNILLHHFSKLGRLMLVAPKSANPTKGLSFIQWFRKQPKLSETVYGSTQERTNNEVECTVLQLIATGMIQCAYEELDDGKTTVVFVSLGFTGHVPTCTVDVAWNGIHEIDIA